MVVKSVWLCCGLLLWRFSLYGSEVSLVVLWTFIVEVQSVRLCCGL